MKPTAVEYLIKEFSDILGKIQTETFQDLLIVDAMKKAKEIEKTNIDNKAIHFAEWLTKKHTLVLMELYEQFEYLYYNEETDI